MSSIYLNKNLKLEILNKLKSSIDCDCTEEYGYILRIVEKKDINKTINVIDNYISNVNAENIFIVEYEAEVLKPEIDKTFNDKICMIFNGGIFVNVNNKFKILIPISYLKDYEYDNTNKIFKKDKKTYKEGDSIDVMITGLKYSKKKFSCFGKIIEDI